MAIAGRIPASDPIAGACDQPGSAARVATGREFPMAARELFGNARLDFPEGGDNRCRLVSLHDPARPYRLVNTTPVRLLMLQLPRERFPPAILQRLSTPLLARQTALTPILLALMRSTIIEADGMSSVTRASIGRAHILDVVEKGRGDGSLELAEGEDIPVVVGPTPWLPQFPSRHPSPVPSFLQSASSTSSFVPVDPASKGIFDPV